MNYILRAMLILLGVLAVVASKLFFPAALNAFWRVLTETAGYMLIALGVFGSIKKGNNS